MNEITAIKERHSIRKYKNQKIDKEEGDVTEGGSTGNFFEDHDVKVMAAEECTLDDGSVVSLYYGTADGHQAVFMADSYGNVIGVAIDENDNGNVDECETIDLCSYHITDQQLAECHVEQPNQEIELIGVANNVEMDGQTVDVAAVNIGGEQVYFVDVNQDGKVDFSVADLNHNEEIEEGEVQDISSSQMVMPTSDDVAGDTFACTDDGLNDYSNDADTTGFEV